MIHDLALDSKGHCFLCLEQILKTNVEKDDSAAPSPPLHSLHDLSNYLDMDLGKVLNEKEPIPQELLAKLENSRLKVTLCEECTSLNEKFSELFQQLERINLEAVSCVKRIHGQLSRAVTTGHYKRFRTIFSPVEGDVDAGDDLMIGKLKIVNLMRIETMRKSAKCLYKAKRQIKLHKPTAKINTRCLTPQMVSMSTVEGLNSEDFDDVKVDTLEDVDCNMEGSSQSYDLEAIEDLQHQSAGVEEENTINGSPVQTVISPSKVDLHRTLKIVSVQGTTEEKCSPEEVMEPHQFGPSQANPSVEFNIANMEAAVASEKIKSNHPSEPNFNFHSENEDSCGSSENELIIDEERDNQSDCSPMEFNDDQSLSSTQGFSDSNSGPTIIKIESTASLNTDIPLPNSQIGDEDVSMAPANGKPQDKSNSDAKSYKCSTCNMEFISRSGLQSHRASVHLNVRYQCQPCNKEFVGSGSYRRHYRSVHMGLRYVCGACGKSYSQICHLKYHERTSCVSVNRNPGFPCHLCGKVLAAANVLQRHVKTVHMNLREHACTFCTRTYHLNCQLQQHLQKVHAVSPDETSGTSAAPLHAS